MKLAGRGLGGGGPCQSVVRLFFLGTGFLFG